VTHDRAILLGQAREIENSTALTFQMRCHPKQGTNRDHTRSADAGDENAIWLMDVLRLRHRKISEWIFHKLQDSFSFRSDPFSTVTKLGQKPFTQEKSLLQLDWSI
jgi:hypothetical protein